VTFTFQDDFEEPWPPPGYFAGGAFNVPHGAPLRICSPLQEEIVIAADGSRHLSYQIPIMPIDTNHPLYISGGLRVTDYTAGSVLDLNQNVVGTFNAATGIFDINLDLAPGPQTRFVEYFSNGQPVFSPRNDPDPNAPLNFVG
jgi:hypothetical protein